MVQLAPAATELPQLFVWAKSPLLAPVMPMAEIVSRAVPEFVRVKVFGAVVVPTVTLPKLRFVADRVTAGELPVPVRLTLCGLPLALSVTARVAPRVPAAVGVKVTLIVQFAPA